MVPGGQPLAAQSELPPNEARDAVVASEQGQVDRMYGRLDSLRELTQQQLTETRAMGASGTPAARSERDAFATEYERRLIQLRGVENGLCFGRLDLNDGQRYYVGRIGLSESRASGCSSTGAPPPPNRFTGRPQPSRSGCAAVATCSCRAGGSSGSVTTSSMPANWSSWTRAIAARCRPRRR